MFSRYETAEEKATRYGIFKENRVYIKKMNEESEGVTFDINQFADLTHDEFAEQSPGIYFTALAPSWSCFHWRVAL